MRRKHCNGPFQDALDAEYSKRLEAASRAILEGMAAKYGVTTAELAHAVAWAASREIEPQPDQEAACP